MLMQQMGLRVLPWMVTGPNSLVCSSSKSNARSLSTLPAQQVRSLHTSSSLWKTNHNMNRGYDWATEQYMVGYNSVERRKGMLKPVNSWEVCKKYMHSKEYFSTYGDRVVWFYYRRNIAGSFGWSKQRPTRPTCIDAKDRFMTNWPCTVCRDEYLLLDYRIPELFTQFLEPVTGLPIPRNKTGICRRQYDTLQAEVIKSMRHGIFKFHVPYRAYDYADYYPADIVPPEELPEYDQAVSEHPTITSGHPEEFSHVIHPVFNPERKPLGFAYDMKAGSLVTKREHYFPGLEEAVMTHGEKS